jgi:hypothetical protein
MVLCAHEVTEKYVHKGGTWHKEDADEGDLDSDQVGGGYNFYCKKSR